MQMKRVFKHQSKNKENFIDSKLKDSFSKQQEGESKSETK